MRHALAIVVLSLVVVPSVLAVSADQEIVSAVGSPNPVVPGNNITYTITLRNNGPDAATNGGLNVPFPQNLTFLGASAPAGWSCSQFGQSVSCTTPSFAPSTVVITMTAQLDASRLNFPDGSVTVGFSTAGVTPDPNLANNSKSVTTNWDSPQIDMALTVTDSPDPVTPDNNITYTVTATNNGPDSAIDAKVSSFNNGTLLFQSATIPAGWSCNLPSVNAAPTFTCTVPTLGSGATAVFTIVVRASSQVLGNNNTTVSTFFGASATGDETNHANDSETETTAYMTPHADLGVSATDSPDPVTPDNNITYTVTVTNNGPDAATNATVSSFNNGTLQFQSATVPSGWTCNLPAVNGTPTFSCSTPSLANGGSATFTFVVKASLQTVGVFDTTLSTHFSVGSSTSDPNSANDGQTVTTSYVTPDSDMAVTVSDSPDPVTPDHNITYTVTVTNNGPDPATNATLSTINSGNLQFQSATVPSGWNCTLPAVNGNPSFNCTNPSFANGASSVFTVVVKASSQLIGINNTTVSMGFTASSPFPDPNNSNNSKTETTAYVTLHSDMQVAASDSPDPVAPDGNITYTVTVTNAGPDAAANAELSVPLNNTLLFQSVTVPSGWSCAAPPVNSGSGFDCTNPSLAASASSVFTIVLRAAQSQFGIHDTTINQVFVASSSNADPNNANNTATVSTQYKTPDANLAITATDSPDPVANGANLTYTVNVANNGPDAAPSAQVTLSPHASLQFQSIAAPAGWSCTTPAVGATGAISCTNASFASGAGAAFTLVEKLAASGSGGTISSVFSVSSSVEDPVLTNNSVEVFTNWTGQSTLTITKSTPSTSRPQGSTLTYTITASNLGPDAASSPTVTDVLPSQLRFQSIAAPAGWSCTTPAVGANGTVTCTIATFANGATATFTLTTTVATTATGSIANSASVGSVSASAGSVLIAGTADLGVTTSAGAPSAAPGSTLGYTITVTNAGPDPAAGVTMTDVLPPSLQFGSIAPPSGWSCNNVSGTVTCTAPTLPAGGTATFLLSATVISGASGSIANSATATHSGSDPSSANNSGSAAAVTVARAVTPVPTLSGWALLALGVLLAGFAVRRMA